jgi:hypothetical protein
LAKAKKKEERFKRIRPYFLTLLRAGDFLLLLAKTFVVALVTLFFIIIVGTLNLLDFSLIASLVVVEVPIGAFLYLVLGERRHQRQSEAVDRIELASKYGHLRLHYWDIGYRALHIPGCVIENKNTHKAYVATPYLWEWAKWEIIEKIHHKNEREMREFFTIQDPPIVIDEEYEHVTPRQLLP